MQGKNQAQDYEDILNLPHHSSASHPHMPIADRAAQFSPFAALTGYGEAIKETGRLTSERRELDEDAKSALDEQLQMLREQIPNSLRIVITYFQPDDRKAGGAYVTVEGRVKKLDVYGQAVVMQDGTRVPFEQISGIEAIGSMPDSETE